MGVHIVREQRLGHHRSDCCRGDGDVDKVWRLVNSQLYISMSMGYADKNMSMSPNANLCSLSGHTFGALYVVCVQKLTYALMIFLLAVSCACVFTVCVGIVSAVGLGPMAIMYLQI